MRPTSAGRPGGPRGRSPLAGRTVVITGAARGVGAALARELAGRGARIALLGHEGTALDAVANTLPTPSLALDVDVTDADALRDAARAVRRGLGRPSVVVANAGIAQAGPFETADLRSWRRVIDVNLTGSAHTARAFQPDLLLTRGYYLQIASTAALTGMPLMSAYCAAKAGVETFAHALRAETAHRGMAVGIAYLHWIGTDLINQPDRVPALREVRALLPPPARHVSSAHAAASCLAQAVEDRRTAVYVPSWTRVVQVGRIAWPGMVARRARLRFSGPGGRRIEQTGPLGHGGAADLAGGR
ncbi:short-chain dehydrogenase/reductase [Streptomyces sp. B8F3]|uniref:short-chain dehydrogenase/reductase n=1 Tax=Streptomyces sp. B8F3 TaxID=3153573 RepID=UPI00325C992A